MAYFSKLVELSGAPCAQLLKVWPEALTVPLTAMLTDRLPVLVRSTLPAGDPTAAEAAIRV
jgi:hypothetical protein